MKTLFLRSALAAVSLALAACATPLQQLPAGASLQDVHKVLGQPDRSWPEADGGRTLQYASQPFGITCWNVRLDAGGKVVSVVDSLATPTRWDVQPGMTTEQVDRLLGPHRSVQFFSASGETVWDWNIDNSEGPGTATLYNVHFKDGKVVRTSITFVFPGDGGDRR